MLSGTVCPVTTALAATGVMASIYFLGKGKSAIPSASKFALVSAAVFALQMLNYPIWNGVSGHLIGGVFAAVLLGAPAAVLSVALVLLLQTLLFADGGISMLGANITNMALIGAGLGGLIHNYMISQKHSSTSATMIAAGSSVILAAFALCAELALSGKGNFQTYTNLIGAHAILALIEGMATLALVKLVQFESEKSASKKQLTALGILVIVALAFSPLASSFPDAFEWTMQTHALLPDTPNFTNAPFADYTVSTIANSTLSGILAGVAGIVATLLIAYASARLLKLIKA